ncbi:MAG: hypothetical protein R3B99_33705, partial [Polyangiales bacterium]
MAGLGVAAVVLALSKLGRIEPGDARLGILLAAGLPVVAALVGALRRVPQLLPAQLLDRSHALASRLANALELSQGGERTPFAQAAIEDAEAHADGLSPKRAMPLRAPKDLGVTALLAVGVAGLSLLEVPREVPVPMAAELEPLLLDEDALDGFESSLEPVLRDRESSEDVRQAARALNQVLEDMADRRLDRTEALRRLQQIEQQLAEGRPMSAEQVEEQLREMGRELERSALATAASEALRDADASQAARAMQELAERLETETPSRQELERLRQAMERAARENEERQLQENQREREELERLLRRQREEQQTETEEQRRLLRRRQRDLERLQREQQQLEEQHRQLDRLRREMQQTAEELNRRAQDRQQQSESMRRMAEELNRMAREQMNEEQRR